MYILRGSSDSNAPTSEVVCRASTALICIGDCELLEQSNIFWCIGLSPAWVGYCCASVAVAGVTLVITLKGFNGRFKLLRLRGMMGWWGPYSYGIVSSLESFSIVAIFGSWDATDEIVISSLAWAPDSSVELKISGVFFCGWAILSPRPFHVENMRVCWIKRVMVGEWWYRG